MISAFLMSLCLLQDPPEPPVVGGPKPTLKLPETIQAQPGKHFAVKLETDCKWIEWQIPAGLERVPIEFTEGKDKWFVGYGSAGKYDFVVRGSLNDVHTETKCSVTIGGGKDDDNKPNPSDPLAAQFQALYTADKTPNKATHLANLVSIYDTAADSCLKDPEVTTCEQMFAILRKMGERLLPAKEGQPKPLQTLRDALAVQVKICFPTDGPLTDDLKKSGAACFSRLAGLLKGIK